MRHPATSIADRRELSAKERTLVQRLLRAAGADGEPYVQQVPALHVVARCSCGCPSVDFGVGDRTTDILGPTSVIAEGDGISPEGVRFGVLLHIREGLLSELEIYAMDLEPPFTLLDVDQIHINAG